MKLLLLIPFFILGLDAHATDYYVAANGNDANNGTSSSSPWQTLNKVNAYFNSLNPGDRVLLNRGDVFYGSITASKSGNSGSPITISAYGSGNKPVITGFTTVTAWTNLGGNIWESSNAVSALPYTNMVVVNGVNTAMGRWPNTGTLPVDSYSGTSIKSSALAGSLNWAGAELAIFRTSFSMGRSAITSQSGTTINYQSSPTDLGIQYEPGWFTPGFFIQNDPRTLDTSNEWYYNPTTKKLRIYSIGTPQNVQIPTIETLFYLQGIQQWFEGVSYVTIDNISFTGSNTASVLIKNSKNISVQNCDFTFSGGDAIYGPWWGNSTGLKIENCQITNSNSSAIDLSGNFDNAAVRYNTIQNSGILAGMGGHGGYNSSANCGGVLATGLNTVIEYNNIDGAGYVGICFSGNNSSVNNNYLTNFCKVFTDGGGIYVSTDFGAVNNGLKIKNNIVMNSPHNSGIYLDGNVNGVEVSGNSVANCSFGIYLNNVWNVNVFGNTTFGNGPYNYGSGVYLTNYESNFPSNNISITNNIFFSKTNQQNTALYALINGIFPSSLSIDNNYYARPVDDDKSMISNLNNNFTHISLSSWQAVSGRDVNSKKSPKTVTDSNDLRFEYNAGTSNKTISLGANYIDVKNVSYNGSITLAPYTSVALIKNGAATNQQPTAQAGSDQTITLPTNSITLNGSGSVSGGTISSYSWTQISGPGGATIAKPNFASTTVSGLVQGTYQFQLTVTDNNGATATSSMQVTVNSAINLNLLPAVNPSNTVNGIDYKYYEGSSYNVVPDFSTITPVKTGTSSGFDITSANRATVFSFNFTGYINVPTDGQYTFYTSSDDGSLLYIDGVLVVNNDGQHGIQEGSGIIGLKAGKHAVSVGYFQQGIDKVLSVSYAGPGISKQIIPGSALYRVNSDGLLPAVNPANTVNGIDYKYYEGSSYNVVPDFSTIIPVKTGTSSGFDITLANRATVFSFNFTGYINVPTDGQYTFYTSSDDGSLLYIDGVLVVNNDGQHGIQEGSGIIGLKAGKHAVSVGYFQQGIDKVLSVSYAGPGISKQIIPGSALYRVNSDGLLPAVYPANTVNGIDYKYYEGSSYSVVPDFSTITPIKTGTSGGFDITLANRTDNFSFNFTGYINVPSDGQYTFYTTSDDGSLLYIDGIPVVNNDGLHAALEMSGIVGLKAGMHFISVGFFQQGGGKSLTVSYGGPGISKQVIPSSSLFRVSVGSRMANNPGQMATIPTVAIAVDSTTSLSTLSGIKVNAYPNPFANSIIVSINGDAGNYQLILIDASGRTLMMKNGIKSAGNYTLTINTSSFQKGIYFLRVIQNNQSSVIKLEK